MDVRGDGWFVGMGFVAVVAFGALFLLFVAWARGPQPPRTRPAATIHDGWVDLRTYQVPGAAGQQATTCVVAWDRGEKRVAGLTCHWPPDPTGHAQLSEQIPARPIP